MVVPGVGTPEDEDREAAGGSRPQSLLLTFFGGYVLGRGVAVSTGSVLEVLGRVGVSEHAVRSTLSRMARRDLLRRVRQGRQGYVRLTPERRPELPDALARQLALQTDWLRVIRQDPRLPVQHLPEGWPAERAQRLFLDMHAELDDEARAVVADVLDVVPDDALAR